MGEMEEQQEVRDEDWVTDDPSGPQSPLVHLAPCTSCAGAGGVHLSLLLYHRWHQVPQSVMGVS